MTAGTIVTMIITIGIVWGGLALALTTALKKERAKEQ
jgi:hypothetical protein